jgi:hypothetical protein
LGSTVLSHHVERFVQQRIGSLHEGRGAYAFSMGHHAVWLLQIETVWELSRGPEGSFLPCELTLEDVQELGPFAHQESWFARKEL